MATGRHDGGLVIDGIMPQTLAGGGRSRRLFRRGPQTGRTGVQRGTLVELDASPRHAGSFAPFLVSLASTFDSRTVYYLIPETRSAGIAELGQRRLVLQIARLKPAEAEDTGLFNTSLLPSSAFCKD